MLSAQDLYNIQTINRRFHGENIADFLAEAGEVLANKLWEESMHLSPEFGLIATPTEKGLLALTTAKQLILKTKAEINLYLIGRVSKFELEIAESLWEELRELASNNSNLRIHQDIYAQDLENHPIIVDFIDAQSKATKRIHDVIKRFSHFRQFNIAIEYPAPHYSWHKAISLNFAKTGDADVVKLNKQFNVSLHPGPGEVQYLFSPKFSSHKQQNGKLLILNFESNNTIVGYLEAIAQLNYLSKAFVFNHNQFPQHNGLTEFIAVNAHNLEEAVMQSESILIIGTSSSFVDKALVNHIFTNYSHLNFITDEFGLRLFDLQQCKPQYVVTPATAFKQYGSPAEFVNQTKSSAIIWGNNLQIWGTHPGTQRVEARHSLLSSLEFVTDESKQVLLAVTAVFSTKNDNWLTINSAAFITEIALRLRANGDTQAKLTEFLHEAWKMCREF